MDEFLQALADLRNQANTLLAGLPPLEQFEAAQDLAYGLRSLTSYGNSLVEMTNNLKGKVEAFQQKMKTDAQVTAEATVKEKLLSENVVVLKVDAEAATQAAVSQAQADTRALVVAESAKKEQIAQRRQSLVADKKLPMVAAEKISDEVLGGEDFETHVAKVTGRVEKLATLGLKPETATSIYAELAALATDEAGEAEFHRRFTGIEETARHFRAGGPQVNPLAGAGTGGTGDPSPAAAARKNYF